MAPSRIVETVSRNRGTTMAVAMGSAIIAALSVMYIMGKDSKDIEGRISPHQDGRRMTSSDVSATVSIPKPGKDRFPS